MYIYRTVCNMQLFFKSLFMEIRIEAGEPFEEIKKIFCERFPYLKIECLCNDDLAQKKLNSCTGCAISITKDTTVADLVKQFKSLLAMPVKVLRKADSLWIETSLTDGWTLEKQNAASKHFHES
jgi:hypothetical protein